MTAPTAPLYPSLTEQPMDCVLSEHNLFQTTALQKPTLVIDSGELECEWVDGAVDRGKAQVRSQRSPLRQWKVEEEQVKVRERKQVQEMNLGDRYERNGSDKEER